jgi:hypothetical protein
MKQFKLNAAARLVASTITQAKAPAASEWWQHLEPDQKKEYIEEHPHSKYAEDAIREGSNEESKSKKDEEELGTEPAAKSQINPEHRKKIAGGIRKHAPKIASFLKKTFPLIHEATSALKHLATGKALEENHKEALYDLGGVALKATLSSVVGVHGAQVLGRIGITAVNHAVEHFKEKKEQSEGKDDVEVFVEALADGVEQAKEAPVPKEHAAPKSSYRSAIGRHIRSKAHHITQVLDKSFQHIKPATQGLVALSEGQKLSDEQKTAMKSLGKITLGLSIAALPGGLAAHLAAGVGSVAITHAFKLIQSGKFKDGHIIHHFVESIGEGLEDALLEHTAGGEGEG